MSLRLHSTACLKAINRSFKPLPLPKHIHLSRRPTPLLTPTVLRYARPTSSLLLLRATPSFSHSSTPSIPILNEHPHYLTAPTSADLAPTQTQPTLLARLFDFLNRYLIEPILTVERFLHLIVLFFPVIMSAPVVLFGTRVKERDNERSGTLWWYGLLVRQMEKAGPTFIKLAQWAASRTDIFPSQLCTSLSKLHSHVDPHPFVATRAAIERAFGLPLEAVFSSFDTVPMGIGAIAQVYKARLRPNVALEHRESLTPDHLILDDDPSINLNTTVAVKVLHPYVRATILRDLKIMTFFARLSWLIPSMIWVSLPEEVSKFGEMMQDQLDLRVEAENLRNFGWNFKERRTAKFPRPLVAFTTREILVEEYELGVPLKVFLDAAAEAKSNGRNGEALDRKIAAIGLDSFLHMLILDNFIHADLHPGNMLIKFYKPSVYHRFRRLLARLTGRPLIDHSAAAVQRLLDSQHDAVLLERELRLLEEEGYQPQVIFLDAGLVTTLNTTNRLNFLDLFRAIAEFDGYRAGTLMIERCRTPELVVEGEVFALKMEHLVLDIRQRTFQLSQVKISNILRSVMTMVREHHVKLEGDFVNVVISVLLLEGIGRQLDPELDLLKSALPILREFGTRDGPRKALKNMKEIPGQSGWWLRMWALLEAREWLRENRREYEWMQLCDILCPNI